MHRVFISLGANLGDRGASLSEARQRLNAGGLREIRASSLYETAAWGQENQQPFYNQVLEMETFLPPRELMHFLLDIEQQMGRVREEKYGPRKIDLDILFYDDAVIDETALTIPHPYLHQRRFVLTPLAEIAPALVHPVLNKTIRELEKDCSDTLPVQKI